MIPQDRAGDGQPASHPFMNEITHVSPTIMKYLNSIAGDTRRLDLEQLSEVHTFRQATWNAETVEHGNTQGQSGLDLPAVLDYMTSSESDVVRPLLANDLNHSITSYYISSSHNTYLTGNQLYGDASTGAYTNV